MSSNGSRLIAGPAPRRTASARVLGPVLGLVLIAVGVIGVQHLAAVQGWTTQASWATGVAEWLDGQGPEGTLLALVTVLGLLGVVLLGSALSLPRRSHRYAGGEDDVELWITGGALAAVAADAADRAEGVLSARAEASRRGVRVRVVGRDADRRERRTEIAEAVRGAVQERLGDLPAGRIKVDVKEETS